MRNSGIIRMSIFEQDDMTLEELNKIWEKSTKETIVPKKILPLRIYELAKQQYNVDKKKDSIMERVHPNNKKHVEDIILLDNDTAIIKLKNKISSQDEYPSTFYKVYHCEYIHDGFTTNYDQALVMALLIRNKLLHTDAHLLISKMLGIEEKI